MSTEHFKLEGFDEWLAWLNYCQKSGIKQMNDAIGRSIVIQGFNNAASHTPRRTGRLVQSMNMGAPESYSKIKASVKAVDATYGSCVPYAIYAENGFTQHKGQFVPGYWSGGKFVYVKGAKTGMVLTGQTVEGRHMFQKSLDELRDDHLPKIVNHELGVLFAKVHK